MSFNLPTEFSKEILNPRKYTILLDRLAVAGYDTPGKLRIYAKRVIKTIETLTGNDSDEKTKQKKRYYLSAIFWVMTPSYNTKKNPYYKYYQTVLPSKNNLTDEAWVPKSQL